MSFWDDIKRNFNLGNITTKLIYINLGAFVLYKLLQVVFTISGADTMALSQWLAVPAQLPQLVIKPWTIISYQFLHWDFMHLLFNMLWLYWFGPLFLSYFSQRQILSVYFWGGLWGAIFYLLSFNFIPYYQDSNSIGLMLGASASILAIVVAAATAMPNREIQLMLIGRVKLKYLAIGTVVIDLLSITSATNAGGHISHLGGAFAGYWFTTEYLKNNRDISLWIAKMVDFFATYSFKRRPKMKVRHTGSRKATDRRADMDYNKRKKEEQVNVDKILEKIKQSGYESLSKKEKEELFKASK